MPKHKTRLMLAIAVVLGIIILMTYLANGRQDRWESVAQHAVHPTVGPIHDVITGKGTVTYMHQAVVKAQRAGRVDHVWVNEGESVRSGQFLVHTIDAEVGAESAIRDAERQKVSARIAALQQEEVDLSRMVASGAAAPYDLTQKRLELDLAHKDLDISIQDRKRLEINKARATAASPFKGIVVTNPVSVGQWVMPGDDLLTIAGGSARNIVAFVDATDLTKLSVGQEVAFSDQPDSDSLRKGHVSSISRVVDGTQRQNSVKVIVESTTDISDLRLSQQLYLEFIIRDAVSVLRVPKDYVYSTEKGSVVYVLNEKGASPRIVKITSGDRSFDQVLSGLESTDRIVRQAVSEGWLQ